MAGFSRGGPVSGMYGPAANGGNLGSTRSFRASPGAGDCNPGDCLVGEGEECVAFGINCGGRGGTMANVPGGAYVEDINYRYVGYGGDFDVRRRSGLGFLLPACAGFLLLSMLPLLLWWLLQPVGYDCDASFATWEASWSKGKRAYCCEEFGRGCERPTRPTTALPETTPTVPPTPHGPVDPFNCAVDAEEVWVPAKKDWCCKVHHKACITTPPPMILPPMPPTAPPHPPDPYNCAEGFANWQAGWSASKKDWCCKVHGKGCGTPSGGCSTSAPFDCDAGFGNWMRGWSVAKKTWCCAHEGKACQHDAAGCA